MSEPVLIGRCDGQVLVLTLNRPTKLNALNRQLIGELSDALDAVEADPSVRVIVVTGAGRAFSAGADIAEFAGAVEAGAAVAARDFVRPGQELTRRMESFRKPIIAAVNGLALGGGCEIVEAMHLAIASDEATFSKAEINIGIIPVFGGTQRLPRHVGRKLALEMILTGQPIDAEQALARGLINKVVRADLLLDEAIALGRLIAEKPEAAVTSALRAVSRGMNASIDEGLLIEALAFEPICDDDFSRGEIRRFLDRRRR